MFNIFRSFKCGLRNLVFLLKHAKSPQSFQRLLFLLRVFSTSNAEFISCQSREKSANTTDALIYGEIDFVSFVTILKRAEINANDVFVDLGSGAGKALQTVALYFCCKEIIGVEILPELVTHANELLLKAKTLATAKDDDHFFNALSRIQCIQKDFLAYDFSMATIVFINATCFSPDLWTKIVNRLLELKINCRVIVTTKEIIHDNFMLVDQRMEAMSWGMSRVSIYKKIH